MISLRLTIPPTVYPHAFSSNHQPSWINLARFLQNYEKRKITIFIWKMNCSKQVVMVSLCSGAFGMKASKLRHLFSERTAFNCHKKFNRHILKRRSTCLLALIMIKVDGKEGLKCLPPNKYIQIPSKLRANGASKRSEGCFYDAMINFSKVEMREF